jgi:hypothetical protein
MKPLFAVAAAGLIGVALWKLAAAFLLPLVGVVLGFLFKVALIGGLIWLAVWFFRRSDKGKSGEATQP